MPDVISPAELTLLAVLEFARIAAEAGLWPMSCPGRTAARSRLTPTARCVYRRRSGV